MVTVGTYMQAVSQFAMEQHGVTLRAFGPKIFWNVTSRKNRVDPWANVVGNPVHGVILISLLILSNGRR